MNTTEAIQSRRSVKHFDPTHKMPESDRARLVELAKLAPSSFNMQNYRFLLVEDVELRKQIRAVAWNQAQVTDASLLVILCADLQAHSKNPARYWSHAPKEVQDILVPALTPFYEGKPQLIRDEAMRSTAFAGMTLMLAAIAITLAIVLARRWEPSALAGRAWAPLLLAVGASGGLARVFDETGMAELLAEYALHPRYGVLTPFLAAAIVKTMQGNSLTAVLTASGMVEPMLPALGLDSASGRAIAAAAVGAGSMAVCHVNDPFFWIAAHMGRLSPGRALYVVSLGSTVMAIGALIVIAAIRQFV